MIRNIAFTTRRPFTEYYVTKWLIIGCATQSASLPHAETFANRHFGR